MRSGEIPQGLKSVIACLEERRNPNMILPNMILVAKYDGTSELDVMLAGLPAGAGIKKSGWRGPRETGAERLAKLFDRRRAALEE